MATEPARPSLRRVAWALVRSGAAAVALHPGRNLVTILCVVAIVLPYIVGSAIAHGLRADIERVAAMSPDLHVSGVRYGQPVPVPQGAVDTLLGVSGVSAVVPRIVGELSIGTRNEPVVVVGLPRSALPAEVTVVRGELFAPGSRGELVLGSELAARLAIDVGGAIPPFYRNEKGEFVSRVVGVFEADTPHWQAHVMLTSLETARALFQESESVTSLLVSTRESYREAVAEEIRKLPTLGDPEPGAVPVRAQVTTRDDLKALLLERTLDRETLLQAPLALAVALGIPVVWITAGAGLAERRHAAGLLRALGWSADALMVRAMVESALLAAIGASSAVILAFVWLSVLNGAGLAPVLMPGASASPGFRVPWQLAPVPTLLAFVLSGVLVAAGTLYATWRAATAPPAQVMA